MLAAGIFLLGAALVRRMLQPNPTLESLLPQQPQHHSSSACRFSYLSSCTWPPSCSSPDSWATSNATGRFRPARRLRGWPCPMFAVVWLVAWMVIHTNSRLILALGLTIVAVGCWSLRPPRYFVGGKQLQDGGALPGGGVRVHLHRPGKQHRSGGARSGRLDQRRQCCHVLRIHAFHPHFRRPGRRGRR